jgi:hypothetical protein
VHSIEIGGVTDILKHLRNRARHVACAQQFFRASGDGFKQDVALMGFEHRERSRQLLAIGCRGPGTYFQLLDQDITGRWGALTICEHPQCNCLKL